MSFPARLHVLLARDSTRAVVIRRGPSKRVCSVLWDRDDDRFSVGQWMNGRIYERRCDLSPDGRYLIYFAFNGRLDSETGGAWTAVSRAPWLKAVVLLGKGDCWSGGGLFTGARSYWLNDGYGHELLRDSAEVRRDWDFHPEAFGGECTGVYYPRLIRDGWIMGETLETGRWASRTFFDKPMAKGWTLRKIAHAQVDSPAGKGCYWDEHLLRQSEHGITETFPDWEWAEWDGRRLLYAEKGRLFRRSIRSGRLLGEPRLLFDFNPLEFEAIAAPY